MRFLQALLITLILIPAGYAEDQQFERLKSLAGDWVKEGAEGGDFFISFQLSANRLLKNYRLSEDFQSFIKFLQGIYDLNFRSATLG